MIERIRGRKLQERRLRLWSIAPRCVRCGRLTAYPHGFELDHKVSLEDGGPDTEDNLQILCSGINGCHAKKTAEDRGYKFKPTIGLDGYPIEG